MRREEGEERGGKRRERGGREPERRGGRRGHIRYNGRVDGMILNLVK